MRVTHDCTQAGQLRSQGFDNVLHEKLLARKLFGNVVRSRCHGINGTGEICQELVIGASKKPVGQRAHPLQLPSSEG